MIVVTELKLYDIHMLEKFETPFLLGVLFSKIMIDEKGTRLRFQFPVSKKALADQLKNKFGGSVYIKHHRKDKENRCYIGLDMRSKKSRRLIREAANKYHLPEEILNGFL